MKHIISIATQRSILGHDLWNVNYDGILRENKSEGTFLVGYADNIAAVITARNMEEAQRKLSRVMLRTKTWLNSLGLDLQCIQRNYCWSPIVISSCMWSIKSSVRYLEIRLETRLTFSYQIHNLANKAQKIVGQLSRLMANIGRLLPVRRRLLMKVANIIMLYENEIWAETLEVKRQAHSVQRTAALPIVSGYRTVAVPAVLEIADTIPVDLLAAEQMEICKAKSAGNYITGHFREDTITNWKGR